MNKFLREKSQDTTAEEEQSSVDRQTPTPYFGTKTICPAAISRKQLKDYLFRKLAGAKLDESVREHVETARCAACQRRILELEASEPFLRGDEQLPEPHVEVIRKQTRDAADALEVEELSRKLTTALTIPTAFSLDDLSKMNTRIRTVGNAERRQTLSNNVVNACEARWHRLKGDGKPRVEAAAGELMTLISQCDPDAREAKATPEDLGIKSEKETREFLLYMMTNVWFLNFQGETTWDEEPFAGDTGGDAIPGAQPRKVVFYVDVLKRALNASPGQHAKRDPRPLLV
jgi:hypothetical protein